VPPTLTGDQVALWHAATRVLDANWVGNATVPSPALYPHQWSWDSAFVSIGLARHQRDRARAELSAIFRGQWANGLVPHIVFHPRLARHAYFPGPELWRSDDHSAAPRGLETSGITQPPLHALAALAQHRAAASAEDAQESRAFVKRIYPCLVDQHRYLARARDIGGAGLVSIVHPWESGLDNSPAWDRPLTAVRIPVRRYEDYGPLRGHSSAVGYDRYVWLAATLRDGGYHDEHLRDEHPFVVEDPLVNSVYLASTHALAELAEVAGEDPAPHRERVARVHGALLERLWDSGSGSFRARDLRTDRLIPVATIAGFGPLLDPDLPEPIVAALAELLLSARFAGAAGYPVPSCDIQSSAFDRAAYWRGPTWVNTNWLLWLGADIHGLNVIADLLYGSTLRLVRQSGFREYFDPFDGSGKGSHDFSSTAALVLDLLAGHRGAPWPG
jgi:hypothetical protein